MTSVTEIPAGSYTIDPSHSEVGFTARHAMVTKVRGSFTDVEGSVTVGEEITSSTAQATIAAGSVETRSADRDGHLKSADFFDVETYPSITFASTGLREVSGEGFVLDGDLTVKGVTKPVSLDVEYLGASQDPFGNSRIGFTATTDIEREEWGLSWNAALETGGVLISKKIALSLEISAIKQA